ncbi:MAG TPA: calcium/sodium antiporter [Candidatus Methanoculleus thermohydrogenotrophicum]|jgi:cation:H+ antiporter|nr:calcium/sodium antiporter [Candidatus Methanoculleus thermohydrogenotrophicum]NLM81413.1 calcium/sodium antiporter [Candidatus Methanoculleus thermohydrogenotrophicum]HOB17766.1 calcium/sodium antiporter [Candidatus Methanoculleus thermohydrogenotrophicum]HPZ37985.1 calcium/sodium antiporter [Candidatus Methanoculleus thermohydrogenotrophicum]
MILSIILFIIGIMLLVKGADLFVGGGSGFALRHSISPALIGFTIIAFGTSLPELVVSTNAAATGNTDIALGNVLGSNIANLALILALCTFVRPDMIVNSGTSRPMLIQHTRMMLVATAAFTLLAATLGTLGAFAGAVLLALFAAILAILWRDCREERAATPIKSRGWADALYIGLGLVTVIIGAHLVVESAVAIAEGFGIPAFVIGLSVVAVGTSLPELATSFVAAVRNEGAISVGNILGSNIFNLLLVLGVSLLIAPVTIGSLADIIAVFLFTVAILPLFSAHPSVVRGWSVLMLVGYAAYIAWSFGAAPFG